MFRSGLITNVIKRFASTSIRPLNGSVPLSLLNRAPINRFDQTVFNKINNYNLSGKFGVLGVETPVDVEANILNIDPMSESETIQCTSVLRKRRLKMKKHKLRKRRKAASALKRKLGK